MNYYERYCGDYARDTAHLSLQEHGAYTLMLDTYYATEIPLPADYKALYRLCRAMGAKEQAAVRSVADQFFKVSADGMRHNPKADSLIADARPRIDAAQRNGKLGGRPRKEPSGFPDNNPVGLDQEPTGKAHQHQHQQESKTSPPGVFDFGIALLGEQGVKEKSARSFIGSLLKEWDEATVEEALRAAVGKVNVQGYVRGVLKNKPTKGREVFPL